MHALHRLHILVAVSPLRLHLVEILIEEANLLWLCATFNFSNFPKALFPLHCSTSPLVDSHVKMTTMKYIP